MSPKKSGSSSLFSLEDQFAFYGSYHTNPVNIAIHIVCVPTIFFTSLVLAHHWQKEAFATFDVPIPHFLGLGPLLPLDVTFPFIVAAAYSLYFISLEPFAGLLYSPILLGMGHFSNVVYDTVPNAMKIAGWAFGASWIAQFIGHGKFEGRAPALLTSLVQSLVLAVFFVFLEVLFMLGYRPALHRRVQNKIGVAITEYRKGLADKKRGAEATKKAS
ncbi:DUF962-domain-containing protein [Meredithblackwellia eburnea MCA 4105]